jgi:hypothetical protein
MYDKIDPDLYDEETLLDLLRKSHRFLKFQILFALIQGEINILKFAKELSLLAQSTLDKTIDIVQKFEDKIVFVYAVPVNGTRMPVAAVKIKASDLPTTIILNNARAMSPQATLSSVDEVNIYAVVSKTGGVGIKSGDFKAEKTAVNVNTTKPISLVIDIIVP